MRQVAYVLALFCLPVLVSPSTPAAAADRNGYTAQYECRGGGPHCSVDVAALAARGCDQTITSSMPWSSINWSNGTLCLAAGDHTWKGTLTIPRSASGNAGNYKVFRYTRGGDNDDDPWHQADGDQAKLHSLIVQASYILIHRITLPPMTSTRSPRVESDASQGEVRHHIFNRNLIEGSGWNGALYYAYSQNCNYFAYDMLTLQNNVIRNFYGTPGQEAVALNLQCGSNLRAVNNEVYDWSAHPVQTGQNNGPVIPGLVLENNDFYHSPVMQTQGGQRIRGEDPVSIKHSGTADSPTRIIQNRIWGSRWTDLSTCCNGQGGGGMTINVLPYGNGGTNVNFTDNPYQYILVQNNIFFENQHGLSWWPPQSEHQSIVGNIFYKMRRYNPQDSSTATQVRTSSTEFYHNSFIDNEDTSIWVDGAQTNVDVRCNVFLSGGRVSGGTSQPSVRIGNNAFYDTAVWRVNASGNEIAPSLTSRAGLANYGVGTIVRTGPPSDCRNASDSACFLYKVTAAGQTATVPANYCTTLGCTMTDGSVQLQAVRGPYTFYRKLRTSPEAYTIPYARPYAQAGAGPAEAYACPSDYASRRGLGISDE